MGKNQKHVQEYCRENCYLYKTVLKELWNMQSSNWTLSKQQKEILMEIFNSDDSATIRNLTTETNWLLERNTKCHEKR